VRLRDLFERGEDAADLGVASRTLDEHGAVSEPSYAKWQQVHCAWQTQRSPSPVTGIAGPDGASPGKPVGTVGLAPASGAEHRSKLTPSVCSLRAIVRRYDAVSRIRFEAHPES